MSPLAMMVVPRGKLLRLTRLVSRASCCSGNVENRGTLRRSSIDTLAGAVIWSVLPGNLVLPTYLNRLARTVSRCGSGRNRDPQVAASGRAAIQPGYNLEPHGD